MVQFDSRRPSESNERSINAPNATPEELTQNLLELHLALYFLDCVKLNIAVAMLPLKYF